ncbi:MAG: hypothetical protein CM15mP58_00500 [Burkholderiaceae bacterium]|nr:MAG: hypothetical protein CM15mP58_00500 [Burkholderiaceae bacterium]
MIKVVDEKFGQTLNDLMSFIINKRRGGFCCIDLIFFTKALEELETSEKMSKVIFMFKGKDLRHLVKK